jgi:hypothetical protein
MAKVHKAKKPKKLGIFIITIFLLLMGSTQLRLQRYVSFDPSLLHCCGYYIALHRINFFANEKNVLIISWFSFYNNRLQTIIQRRRCRNCTTPFELL